MSWPMTRTLGALVFAAALATSSTAAFAATPTSSPALYLTKKRVDTLVGLSQELRTTAIQKARSRPNAPRLTGQGGTQQSQQDADLEMDLLCGGEGSWFITWDEDASGDPIIGTYKLHCGDGWMGIG